MARHIKVAAAQMGPNNEGMSREEIVERMLALLDLAIQDQVELIAYPEMALTTYFPKKIRTDFDQFFENEVPPRRSSPCCGAPPRPAWRCTWASARRPTASTSIPRSSPTATAGSAGRSGRSTCRGRRRPTASPRCTSRTTSPTATPATASSTLQGVKIGIAICQDRRYPESYRALALQGAELILIGYNTPISALALDLNELCLRSGAYANLCFVVGVAKAGVEDGVELIAGSAIINPLGQVIAKAATTGDELIVSRIDLDQAHPVRKRWNFLGRRQPQHYGPLLQPVTEKETHR